MRLKASTCINLLQLSQGKPAMWGSARLGRKTKVRHFKRTLSSTVEYPGYWYPTRHQHTVVAMASSHPQTSLLHHTGPSTSAAPASSGSQTITQSANPTLRLRGQHAPPSQPSAPSGSRNARRIQWDESVIDNEGMGKKSSKVCCIYHKPHEPGDSESDSESPSDSDGDSSGGDDLSRARKAGGSKRNGRGRKAHEHGDAGGADGKGKGVERKASPNAYERQPRAKGKKEGS